MNVQHMFAPRQIAYATFTYVALATALLGHPFWPLIFFYGWQDRLGLPHWEVFIFVGGAAATLIIFSLRRNRLVRAYTLPCWMALSLGMTVLPLLATIDRERESRIEDFAPDRYFSHSIWRSMREAPREFQFYLHADAVKSCTGYGWSYRDMDFYEIPSTVNTDDRIHRWLFECQHAP